MAAAAVETSLSINVGELVARLDRVRPSRFETGAPHPPVDVGRARYSTGRPTKWPLLESNVGITQPPSDRFELVRRDLFPVLVFGEYVGHDECVIAPHEARPA